MQVSRIQQQNSTNFKSIEFTKSALEVLKERRNTPETRKVTELFAEKMQKMNTYYDVLIKKADLQNNKNTLLEGQIIPKNISALADVRTFKVTETNDTLVKQGVNGFFKSVYSKLKDETSKLNRMFGKADINEHEVSPELIKKLTNRININEPTPPSYIKFVSENKVFKD